jgi:hypothetical protein
LVIGESGVRSQGSGIFGKGSLDAQSADHSTVLFLPPRLDFNVIAMQSPRILTGLGRQPIGRKFAPSLGAKSSKSSVNVDGCGPAASSPSFSDRAENVMRDNETSPDEDMSQSVNLSINNTTGIEMNRSDTEMRATARKRVIVTSTIMPVATVQQLNEGAKKQKIAPVLGAKSEALVSISTVHKPIPVQGSISRPLECENSSVVSHYNTTGNQVIAPAIRSRKASVKSKSLAPKKSLKSETGGKLRDFEAAAALSRAHSVLPLCFGEKRGYRQYTVYLHRLPPPVGLGMRLKNVEGKAVVKGFSSPPEMSAEAVKSAAAKQTLLSALAVAGAGSAIPNANSIANSDIDSRANLSSGSGSGSGPNEDENEMLSIPARQNKSDDPSLNPAYAAGVRVNDVIVSVNNIDARTASFDRIVRALVGTGATSTSTSTSSSGVTGSAITAPISSSASSVASASASAITGTGINVQHSNVSSASRDMGESSVAPRLGIFTPTATASNSCSLRTISLHPYHSYTTHTIYPYFHNTVLYPHHHQG